MDAQAKRISSYLVKILVLALVYHLAARLGLQTAYVQANTSPVWPPSGIAQAALILSGIHFWPGITLGVVAGSLITGAPLPLALALGLANTLEALTGVLLLKRFVNLHPEVDRIRDVVGLAATAAVSTAISASIGVSGLFLIGFGDQASIFTLWFTWWVGNLLGVLVITPFITVWAKNGPRWKEQVNLLEGLLFLVLLVTVTGYVFWTSSGTSVFHQALVYVIFPFAIWSALRLKQLGAVTTVFSVSGIAIWGTVHGIGPFSRLPINESLILLQTFMGVVALTSLTLAASASERRVAEQAMNHRVEDLAVLHEASKEFLGNLNTAALLNSICQLVVEKLGIPIAWIELASVEKSGNETLKIAASMQRPTAPANTTETISSDPAIRKHILHALQTGRIAISEQLDVLNQYNLERDSGGTLYFAAFPLGYGGKVVGVLAVAGEARTEDQKSQVLLLESYANLAVVAIQNTWLFDQVRLGNEQLHALSHRLMNLQEQERIHLSRELHDESSQILAGLMVRLGLLERDARSPELMAEHIAELKRIVTEVLNNLRNLAVKLRPASLDHLGLITALKQYVQEYSHQYHLTVQFDAEDIKSIRLPQELETALYRIVQESLTNVALHARAGRVDILLNRRGDCLVMTIEDDGIGFDVNPLTHENGLGLFGMRERVEMLGGVFLIESSPGKGTTISIEVPYDH